MRYLLFIALLVCSIISFGQEEADCSRLNETVRTESDAPTFIDSQELNRSELNVRPIKRTWLKRKTSYNLSSKRITKKSRSYIDWDWLGYTFIYLGGLMILGGFVLIILTTILPWWWLLIGLGAMLAGIFVSAGGAGIVGDKESGFLALGVMFGAVAIGFVSLIVWGLVELILWLVG